MRYKIECRVMKIFDMDDKLEVCISPVSQYKIEHKDPSKGNVVEEYALFVSEDCFCSDDDVSVAKLKKLSDLKTMFECNINNKNFRYAALAAAEAAKSKVRIYVDESLKNILSVDMI